MPLCPLVSLHSLGASLDALVSWERCQPGSHLRPLHVSCQVVVEVALGLLRLADGGLGNLACQQLGLVGASVGGRSVPGRAGGAEDEATDEGEEGGDDAQVKRLPKLKLRAVREDRVVEILQYHVDVPHQWDEAEQPPEDEDYAAHHCHPVLARRALFEDGAPHAHDGEEAGEGGDGAGAHHQGLGRLDVGGQAEQGAVDVALGDARAVRGTLHPQPLGEAHRCHDAGADVGAGLPAGQQRGRQGADVAHHGHGIAQQLEPHGDHGGGWLSPPWGSRLLAQLAGSSLPRAHLPMALPPAPLAAPQLHPAPGGAGFVRAPVCGWELGGRKGYL